jgi:hypothetical protein
MTKIFDLSSCTKNLRGYLKPLATTDELIRLKQYFYYQKNLARRLINYQRLLTLKYNQKLSTNFEPPSKPSNQLEFQKPVTFIDHRETQLMPIIKFPICSTLIATGHGISVEMDADAEQMNHVVIDNEISLSKTCRNIFHRSLYQRKMISN